MYAPRTRIIFPYVLRKRVCTMLRHRFERFKMIRRTNKFGPRAFPWLIRFFYFFFPASSPLPYFFFFFFQHGSSIHKANASPCPFPPPVPLHQNSLAASQPGCLPLFPRILTTQGSIYPSIVRSSVRERTGLASSAFCNRCAQIGIAR